MLFIVMLIVMMMSVIMLSVIMMRVIMLNVVAPIFHTQKCHVIVKYNKLQVCKGLFHRALRLHILHSGGTQQ